MSILLTATIAALLTLAPAHAVPISYTANLNTSFGKPVTDIFIWETNGVQTSLDYAYTLLGRGTSVLSHDVPFVPTQSLITGLTVGQDADGNDKTQIVMFMNDSFASANAGQKFSAAFPNSRHSVLVAQMEATIGGDPDALAYLNDNFFPGDGAAAAFDTSGPFTVGEFTTLTTIGQSATEGNWMINSFQQLPSDDPNAQDNEITGKFNETAKDNLGPFDIEFTLDENGTFAVDKTVLNNTGVHWTDFELLLGFGLGDDFVPSSEGDSLSFINFPSTREETSAFSGAAFDRDRIFFSGGLDDGEEARFIAFISSGTDGEHSITLRQNAFTAAIPEPSNFVLAILGLLSLGMIGRRRRRR
jgi:MYXO-CTERM domain-containing protein